MHLWKRHNIFSLAAFLKNRKNPPTIVKKIILPLLAIAVFSTAFYPVFKASHQKAAAAVTNMVSVSAHTAEAAGNKALSLSNQLYDSLKLSNLGLSEEALQYAYKGYLNLVEKGQVKNPDVLTICDFSQPSNKKRMYILDVKNFKVLLNTYVAHGRNSGVTMAEHFSNNPESLQSSLGFYVTKDTYKGKHGLSLRLDGQEHGFNDNAEARAVVVHGAQYIGDQRTGAGFMGRSFGCPAVPQQLATTVINYIKGGTCLFIYHPSTAYLSGSKLINA